MKREKEVIVMRDDDEMIIDVAILCGMRRKCVDERNQESNTFWHISSNEGRECGS